MTMTEDIEAVNYVLHTVCTDTDHHKAQAAFDRIKAILTAKGEDEGYTGKPRDDDGGTYLDKTQHFFPADNDAAKGEGTSAQKDAEPPVRQKGRCKASSDYRNSVGCNHDCIGPKSNCKFWENEPPILQKEADTTCKHEEDGRCVHPDNHCKSLRSAGKCPKPKATGRKITTPYQCNTATERNGGIVEKEMEKAAVHVKEGDATKGAIEQIEVRIKQIENAPIDCHVSINEYVLALKLKDQLEWVLKLLKPAQVVQQLPDSKKKTKKVKS